MSRIAPPPASLVVLVVTALAMGGLGGLLFLLLAGPYVAAVAGLWCTFIWAMAFLLGTASVAPWADDGPSIS